VEKAKSLCLPWQVVQSPGNGEGLPRVSSHMNRSLRYFLQALLVLALLLLALHLVLPYVIRDYLNDKLADMGDYRGEIRDVDLAWWRGAYRIDGLLILRKEAADDEPPFVSLPLVDLAVSWPALWNDRAVVARVIFESPELNFVDRGEGAEEAPNGQGTDWREQLEKLLPITLDELRIRNGRVAFRNPSSRPPVDLFISDIQASVTGLTTKRRQDGSRTARFEGRGRLLDQAPVEASARFDPFTEFEDFELKLRATEIELPRFNDFSSAYGKFDFKAGHGDLVIEASAENGQLDGYIKPLMRDVDVFDWQQDVRNEDKGIIRSAWEALVGAGENLLKNQRRNQFATRVPLQGSLQDAETSPVQAFFAILRNGFVQAFDPRFEGTDPDE